METNEEQRKYLEFKKKGFILIALKKKTEELFNCGKINKKQKNEIKNEIKNEWRKVYNLHPYIPDSIKQGFNLLYT